MKKLKTFSEFVSESFNDDFYTRNKTHFNSYTNKLSVDMSIPDNKVEFIRYDILKKDMLRIFNINIQPRNFMKL